MKTINDNNAFLMAMGVGSRIEIHTASAKKDSWTQIEKTATTGDVTLTLAEDTQWQVGDKIAIAASGFDLNEAEERTIVKVEGRTITLNAPLEHEHLGEIRTYDNGLTGEEARTWSVDMRAEVALLSRNVTIQGDADSVADLESEQYGYGGHTMVMDGASMHINGVELTRMGQEGEVGRYPLHWHMLEDAKGQFVTNSSIHDTFNKGLTIHGTWNTWIENVAIYENIGHSYYFEDGSEHGNVIKNSLGMNTRKADSVEDAAIGSDHTEVSTFWVTNPANHLIDNHAAGSEDTGFWILSQDTVQGSSLDSGQYDGYSPRAQKPGQWTGNLSHTNANDGLWIGSEFDETDGSKSKELVLEQPFLLSDYTAYSNEEWGIWQRNGHGDYEQIKIVESNAGVQMWGSSRVEDSLFVGRATNDDDPLDQYVGWQLYDNPTAFSGVHFEGYTGALDAGISNGWGFGRSVVHNTTGVTFGADGTEDNMFRNTLTNTPGKVSDQGGPIAGGVIDIDGTLTGTVGAIITPGLVDFRPDAYVDVLTYADDTLVASGFNWSAGAQWLPDNLAWVHAPDTVIGKMVVYQQTRDAEGKLQNVTSPYDADRVVYTIERSDNGAKIEINENAMVSYAWHMQYNLDTSDGVEYVFDYSAETPDAIKFELTELPDGATALYRFKGLPDGVVFQEADAAATMAEFEAATVTTWIRDANGDYLVKAVAQIVDFRAPMRSDEDIATSRVYTDDFKLIVQPVETDVPSGNTPWQRELKTFEAATPDAAPDRAPSTSETVNIQSTDARWSDAGSWDAGLPGVDDIVIIGPGERVVLDTYVKVGAILINGGELVVEDTKDLKLAADWILAINGGLFQVGTPNTPFEHDFELTLEGDDKENDVDIQALLASEDENIVRAVANDPATGPQTTQRVVADVNDARAWDYRTVTLDAAGKRIASEVVFDDGRVSETTFVDGMRTTRVDTDAENATAWDRLQTTFDERGTREEYIATFDDGRVTVTNYADGVRTDRTATDLADARTWDRIDTSYSASGDLAREIAYYDDGRVATTEYVDGVRAEKIIEDISAVHHWTQIKSTFDENGVIEQSTSTFDDGRVAITDFIDGTRALSVVTDEDSNQPWTTITTNYTDTGDQSLMVIDYDDGRVGTTTYEDGVRATVVVEDTGGTYSWQTVTTEYAVNGARLSTTQITDEGASETTEHVSLVKAVNIGGNEFTAINGLVYEADSFGIGNGFGTGAQIAGTENDGLYKIQKWNQGELSYDVAVENGDYLLELNFAETFSGAQSPGQRVFDIFVEDTLVFKDFDSAQEVGFEAAVDLLGAVEVSDGSLSLKLVGVQDNPSLAGFSIWTSDGTGDDSFVFGTVADEFSFL